MRLFVVTAMRNEGPFLLEWVAWLRLMGVDDLLVNSNDCDDGSDDLLDALAAAGVLAHVRQTPPPQGKTVQWQALKSAWSHPMRKSADWAMVVDCDEFPVPLDGRRLKDVLAATAAQAVAFPWRLFGHNGHLSRPDALTTAAFTRSAPPDLSYPALGHFVKSAFRLDGPFTGFGVHRPKQEKGAVPLWHGPDDAPLPESFAARQGQINLWGQTFDTPLVQLNHYSVRSAASFIVKRDRGLPNHTDKDIGLTYWVERNFNAVADTTMARWQKALAEGVAALRALPNVAALERAAIEWHDARFETLMTLPETAQLFGRLALVTGATPPPPSVGRALVRRYQRAVAGETT